MYKFLTKNNSKCWICLANSIFKPHHTLPTNIVNTSYLEVVPKSILFQRESHGTTHPEELKQIIKEQSAKSVCDYYASEEYKQKLKEMRVLIVDDSAREMPKTQVIYEHVINCAQPHPRKKKKPKKPEEKAACENPTKKKIKKIPVKTTIMSVIMRKKADSLETPNWYALMNRQHTKAMHPTALPQIIEQKLKKRNKLYRKRTTILPLILQKTREKLTRENNKEITDMNYRYYIAQDKIGARSISTQKKPADIVVDSNLKASVEGVRHITSLATNCEEADNKKEYKTKEFRQKVHVGKVVNRKLKIRKLKSKKREMLTRSCALNLPADTKLYFDGCLSDIVKETPIPEENETSEPESKFSQIRKKMERQTKKIREKMETQTVKNILTLFKQVKLDTQKKPFHISSHDLTKYSRKKYQAYENIPEWFKIPSHTYQVIKKIQDQKCPKKNHKVE